MSCKQKNLVVVTASAGEIEWLLPIINESKKYDFTNDYLFISKAVSLSISSNSSVSEYMRRQVLSGSSIYKSDSYLFIKSLNKLLRLGRICDKFRVRCKFFNVVSGYFIKTMLHFLNINLKEYTNIFVEFGWLDSGRFAALRSVVDARIVLFPHSPHIYISADGVDNDHGKVKGGNANHESFLLKGMSVDSLGDRADRTISEFFIREILCGHPKYLELLTRDEPRKHNKQIAIFSRGVGSYLSEDDYLNIIDNLTEVLSKFSQRGYIVKIKKPAIIAANTDTILVNLFRLLVIVSNTPFNLVGRLDKKGGIFPSKETTFSLNGFT